MKVTRCNNGEKCDDCDWPADIKISAFTKSIILCSLCWEETKRLVRRSDK